MNLKTYQAYTMAEALAAVKRDLGQSAVILQTRTFKRGGFLGLGRKTVVEVTATVDEQAGGRASGASSTAAPAATVSPSAVGARKAYGEAASLSAASAAKPPSDEPHPVTDEDRERTRRLAQMLVEQYDRRQPSTDVQPGGSASEHDSTIDHLNSSASAADTNQGETRRHEPIADAPRMDHAGRLTATHSRRFILTPEGQVHDEESGDDATKPIAGTSRNNGRSSGSADSTADAGGDDSVTPVRPRPENRQPVELFAEDHASVGGRSDDARAMQDELAAIRVMVGQVLQRQTHTGPGGRAMPSMPQQLFDMYLTLIGQDISEELADRIINDVRDDLTGADLDDEAKLRETMLRHLTDYIPTARQAVAQHSPDDRPLTIALVGPTGVGKTTTLAKLAASFKLRHNRKVGMITSDTYRIAAVDQLRTYANIIGLPLKVALTPSEMSQCVHSLSDCDVILIDTAGRSQNDSDRLSELKQFIGAADPHEVHLVLSGTASEKVLLREAEAFSQVGVDKIVLTKLDEAVSFGMLVNVIRQVGKELSFFTTGQEVPDHIEVGRPERLAELILGGKVQA